MTLCYNTSRYGLHPIRHSGLRKGTQGKILAAKIDAAYFETGGELRRLAAGSPSWSKSEINNYCGTSCAERSRNGNRGRFYKNPAEETGIFDGIPRNKEQNDTLENLLQKLGDSTPEFILNYRARKPLIAL